MAQLTWEEAIQRVLQEAGGALHYADIAEQALTRGYKKGGGATPASTVASILSTSLSKGDSPYVRAGGGLYALRDAPAVVKAAVLPNPVVGAASETGALRAFGMFWKREAIVWSGKPRLLGRQGQGASDVNFAEQIGVYLLHDRDRVIYVGRAADTLYARLKAHTTDRLGGRWDRFSWFGLREVSENGQLVTKSVPWSSEVVIETMEAVLIESLEPPLNRKRGDNFSGAEYLQVDDPAIEEIRKKAILAELAKSAGLTLG